MMEGEVTVMQLLEGAESQEIQSDARRGKRQEINLSPEPPEVQHSPAKPLFLALQFPFWTSAHIWTSTHKSTHWYQFQCVFFFHTTE